jgi:hypothetical protein
VNPLKQLWSGIRWFAPIQRWTSAVTVVFIVGTVFWTVAVGMGLTDVAKAPGDVVVAMYQAAQDGQPEEVRRFLTDGGKKQFDLLAPSEQAALLSTLSRDSTTILLTALGVRNYGKNAVTGLMQDMSDGQSDLRIEVLINEGRFWRVEWPIGVADWYESVRRFDPRAVPRTPVQDPV